MGLPPRSRRSIVCNRSYGTCQVLRKHKSFSFGLELPMHDRIEPTSVFRATRDSCQLSYRSVDVRENDGRKTCFWPMIKDGHAYGCSYAGKDAYETTLSQRNCATMLAQARNTLDEAASGAAGNTRWSVLPCCSQWNIAAATVTHYHGGNYNHTSFVVGKSLRVVYGSSKSSLQLQPAL